MKHIYRIFLDLWALCPPLKMVLGPSWWHSPQKKIIIFIFYKMRNCHNFFLSLLLLIRCIHRLFKQYISKNIWLPLGIEPRNTCLTHERSATELWQPKWERSATELWQPKWETPEIKKNVYWTPLKFSSQKCPALISSHNTMSRSHYCIWCPQS